MSVAHQALNDLISNKASALAVQTFNKAILNPEQAGRFIREITRDQVILAEASVMTMKSHTKNLDRVTLDGRVLHSGWDSDGMTRELDADEKVKFRTWQNQLVATKLKTQAVIEDDELDDNTEGKAFVNTLLDLTGEGISDDTEAWGLGANSDEITPEDDDLLATTKGWLHRSAYNVYDMEIDDGEDVEALFKAMLALIPKKFLGNRNKFRFGVPFEYEDLYRDLLASRGTALGDETIQGFRPLTYRGIPVKHVPSLDDTPLQELTGSPASMLYTPSNLVMGIYKEIFMEPDRHPAKEETEWVITTKGDVNLINEFMNVSAFPELEEPEGSPGSPGSPGS
jgi:hypothetical protein